jgi:hypothetical protein
MSSGKRRRDTFRGVPWNQSLPERRQTAPLARGQVDIRFYPRKCRGTIQPNRRYLGKADAKTVAIVQSPIEILKRQCVLPF